MTNCCSCGAPIFFARTVKGSNMPLDAEPNPAGGVVLVSTATGLVAHVTRLPAMPQERRYMSHFVTCPHAAAHRTPRLSSSGGAS